MNAFHITDFRREWVEQGYIGVHDFNINLVLEMELFRSQILPVAYKDKLREHYQQYIDGFLSQFNNDVIIRRFTAAQTFVDQENREHQLKDFMERTKQLDILRNENFEDVFPEYKDLFKNVK